MSWDQYSQTPASNDLSGYFQTGMAPSKVKNAGWDIMADLAQFMSLPTSGGTANAQTVTNTRQFGALFTGMRQRFIPGNTNTGAVTLAVDGLTAKNVFAAGAAAIAGMLQANVPADVVYDGTQWQLLNPQRSTGSFTLTYTGATGTVTINYNILPDGKTVQIRCGPGQIVASSGTGFTGTGVPAILSSTTEWRVPFPCEDNSAYAPNARLGGTNSTTWTFYNGLSATSWTNAGNKGILLGAFTTYSLD